MRSLVLLILLMLSTSSMLAQLQQYRWKHRLILIFTEDTSQTIYQKQWNNLQADSVGLADRDIQIYTLLPQDSHPALPKSSLKVIQQKYNRDQQPFLCVLIGKDGSVKSRKTSVCDRQDIFNLIDSMPMRQAEICRKKGKHH